MSQLALLTLAPEVKLLIFSHLSDVDLVRCSAVCRLFRELIARSAILQYRIELFFEGLVDGHLDGPNVTDRLRRLVGGRLTWLDLNWKEHKPISLRTRIAHYAPGVLITQEVLKNSSEGRHRLVFHTLPNWETGSSETRLGPPYERQIESMTCDPSQDLFIIFERDDPTWEDNEDIMAVAESQFHLLTLSSQGSAPHPDAIVPVMNVPHLPGGEDFMTLSVMGDLFGVLNDLDDTTALRIINWKTGECIREIQANSCPLLISQTPGTFAFAASELLLLFSDANEACIQIQPILSTGRGSLILRLPSPRNCYIVDPMIFENQVTITSRPGVPFRVSSDACVYHIGFPGAQMALFFKHTSLMSLLTEHLWCHSSNEPVVVPVVVPWNRWGPRHTRAFSCRMDLNEPGYTHGSRAVLPMADIAGTQDVRSSKVKQYILDFNLIRHERSTLLSEDAGSNGKWRLISEPTTLSLADFAEPIVTSLPFYVAPAPGAGQHGQYCIDDKRVTVFTPPDPKSPSWGADEIGEVNVYSF